VTKQKHQALDPHARLSDPQMKDAMDRKISKLASDKGLALKFLQDMGIATSKGRLTKRYS
jgi:hypothetical protein